MTTAATPVLFRLTANLGPVYELPGADQDDSGYPNAGLVFDNKGRIFGATLRGGPSNQGAVFRFTPSLSGAGWKESVLYNFTGNQDGGLPNGGLAIGQKGEVYGATQTGGTLDSGVLFELSPPATQGGA